MTRKGKKERRGKVSKEHSVYKVGGGELKLSLLGVPACVLAAPPEGPTSPFNQ